MSSLAVFVHGYHLGAPGWEWVCWGRGPREMGRGSAALKAAIELDAEAVVFGCGGAKAGHRAYAPDLIHRELVRRAAELGRFRAFEQDQGAQARAVLFERSWFVPGPAAARWASCAAFSRRSRRRGSPGWRWSPVPIICRGYCAMPGRFSPDQRSRAW